MAASDAFVSLRQWAGLRVRSVVRAVLGTPEPAPTSLVRQFPELALLRLRRGGVPVHVAGWALGHPGAAAITLWRHVFVHPTTSLDADLLLHELRHVHQFQASASFPLLYLWETMRRGYHANRFEADARAFASARRRHVAPDPRPGDP
jgi:hypothetical protein